MKTDKPSSHTSRNKKKSDKFDEVDKNIQIPMATRMKMQMNLKMNANGNNLASKDTYLLRTGIDQYRTLQQLNTTNHVRRSLSSAERAAERGVSLMERKQFNAAIPLLSEALETLLSFSSDLGTTSSTVKLYHQRGLCFLATKKYKAAIEDFSQVMQMTPKSAELFAKRGKAYAALGEHHAAMLDYNEAINLAATQGLLHDYSLIASRNDGQASTPGLVQLRGLYLARAKVYRAMNNITHALEDLCHAENSAGGHRDANLYYDRAQLYLQCHQDLLALHDFDRFLELREETEESRHFDASGGVGGLAGFVAPQELTVKSNARVLEVLMERGKLLQRLALEEDIREQKDAELAAVELGQTSPSLKTGPTTMKRGVKLAYPTKLPNPELYRGIESRRLEKRALQDYTKAMELEPQNIETLRLRGEALMHLGRYEDALKEYSSALEIDPNDFEVAMARAKLYRQRGDLKAAVDEVTAILQRNGFFIDGLKMRGQLYEALGMIQEAENDYSSIIHAHFDKSGADKAANTVKVTMELASGGTVHVGSHKKGKGEKYGSNGRITSNVALHALLCRARLRLASEQFNAAEEDYKEILSTFANNMEAQLELQETRERRRIFEQRKQREALAWLELNADEKDSAGVLNSNGSSTSSKNKKKKKKKKKRAAGSSAHASKKERFSAGYVLLEDEEERQGQEEQRIQQQTVEDDENRMEQEKIDRCRNITASDTSDLTQNDLRIETRVSIDDKQLDSDFNTEQGGPKEGVSVTTDEEIGIKDTKLESEKPLETPTRCSARATVAATTSPPVAKATVSMTRDEAWESMMDDEIDEPSEAVSFTIDSQAHSSNCGRNHIKHETLEVNNNSASLNESIRREGNKDQSCHPLEVSAPCIVYKEPNEEASGSSEDGKDGHSKMKAVLMDEKYLKKRERQLKKLRASLQHASDERDKSAIEEALARADRKQMSDALQDDIQRALKVLADIATETQRPCDVLPTNEASSNFPQASMVASEHSRSHPHPETSSPSATSGTLKPSLVIRPIAYGQALQAAEQHQQQLRAHQKLLEEKNAEISELRRLLALNRLSPIYANEEKRRAGARTHAKAAAIERRVNSLRAQFPVDGLAARQADELIEWMCPSEAADRVRQQVISFVQRIISAHFPLAAAPLFYPTGSYPMKTYLPGSDLDICLLLPQELETSWYFMVMQALCVAGGSGGAGTVLDLGVSGDTSSSTIPCAPSSTVTSSGGSLILTNTVRNVTFINAEVRVVKCTIDNISVDITANRVGALGAVRLLDAMAARVGRHHLFKKSIILIKAWCTHESSGFMEAASVEAGGALGLGSTPSNVMGASHGALSTYAVNTIVMALFNQHGDIISHPLQALYMFLDQLAEFPWHESALTLLGPVPLSYLATAMIHETPLYKSKPKTRGLDAEDIEAIRDTLADQFGAFDVTLTGHKGASTIAFPIRACNIVDPLDDKNNLARSVSAEVFPILKRAFRLARDRLAAMLVSQSVHSDDDAELLNEEIKDDEQSKAFFARCWKLYGRGDGWRPDLLIHPRQTWHGKTATSLIKKSNISPGRQFSATLNKSDEDEDSRWESLLPSLDARAANALLLQYQQLHQQAAAAAYHHRTMIAYQQPYFGPLPRHGHPMGSPRSTSSGSGVQSNGNTAEPTPGIFDEVTRHSTTLHHPYESPQRRRSKSPPPHVKSMAIESRRVDATSPLRT
ncbi:putative tetratricopeptide-like helical domain superfamily [Plasmopara halstedii]